MRKHAVVPPFRALDPELGVAERLLRKGNPQLCDVVARLPDCDIRGFAPSRGLRHPEPPKSREHAAARRLNAVLAGAGARPRLVGTGTAWRIVYVTPHAETGELAAGAAGLAELVTVGGWRRVKRCATCARPFCDRTSGCTRKWCAEHRRASSGVD